MKQSTKVGIVSYGAIIPRYRIKAEEIAATWNKHPESIIKGLGIYEKAVADFDQDTASIAVDAATSAMNNLSKKPHLNAIYVGSESHPYVIKPTATIVGEAINSNNHYFCADLEFACKAGTAGLQINIALLKAQMIEYGMAIGADTAQSRPGDILEYTAAAAGAAYVLGRNSSEIIAEIETTNSYTSDTPDFWRRENQTYPMHSSRFTGEPAYFKHIKLAVQRALEQTNYKISDFDHVVLHMPNSKFPRKVAASLGVSEAQLEAGFTVPWVGNSYSACSLVGLAKVLDQAEPDQLILLCSYGSGSGSDVFVLRTTKNIKKFKNRLSIEEQINNKKYISYAKYIRIMEKLKR